MGPRKVSAAEEDEDIEKSVDLPAEVSAVKLQERNVLVLGSSRNRKLCGYEMQRRTRSFSTRRVQ